MLDCFAYALVPNLVDVCKQLLTSWQKNINTGYLTFYGALSMSQNAIKFSEKKYFQLRVCYSHAGELTALLCCRSSYWLLALSFENLWSP